MPIVSWPAGHKVRGSETATLATRVDSLTAPGWTAYTPTWTASSNPSLGNGTLAGRYRRSATADIVYVEIRLIAGSTTTYGSGGWIFSLPVNASATAQLFGIGSAWLFDSGVNDRSASSRLLSATTIVATSPSGTCNATTPWTWATSDMLRIFIAYEPA